MSAKIYDIITNRIIEELEKGVVPWRRPWTTSGNAVNWKTGKPYRGINTLLLQPGEYATFKQITEAGGKVKKGAKSHIVVFWTWLEKKKDKESEEIEKIPLLRYYKVFEINSQCEGLKSKRTTKTAYDHDPIEEAEKILRGYTNGPEVKFALGRAFYRPSADMISVPPITDYKKPEEYYSTLFHEHVHGTGHQSRLHREGVTGKISFGSETYSKEELVAEIGAAMLCGVAGIDNSTIENSAAYIGGWLQRLKDDKRLIVQAAAQAQKAVDFILGTTFEELEAE